MRPPPSQHVRGRPRPVCVPFCSYAGTTETEDRLPAASLTRFGALPGPLRTAKSAPVWSAVSGHHIDNCHDQDTPAPHVTEERRKSPGMTALATTPPFPDPCSSPPRSKRGSPSTCAQLGVCVTTGQTVPIQATAEALNVPSSGGLVRDVLGRACLLCECMTSFVAHKPMCRSRPTGETGIQRPAPGVGSVLARPVEVGEGTGGGRRGRRSRVDFGLEVRVGGTARISAPTPAGHAPAVVPTCCAPTVGTAISPAR